FSFLRVSRARRASTWEAAHSRRSPPAAIMPRACASALSPSLHERASMRASTWRRMRARMSGHRLFPSRVPGVIPDQRVDREALLLLEGSGDGGRATPVKPIWGDGPAAVLHALLPAAQVGAVGVVAGHGLLRPGLGSEVPATGQR